MYYNYIILVIIILVLISDTIYDFLRKKLDFLPKKRGQRLFLYFIYLFPLIITAFSPVKDNFNIFHSIKEYMSFYATALTITFTVYSFLETQKATEKDRKEREDQQNKEREDRENKDFELREKELEAKRDYYRPIFLIKDIENNSSEKQVTLLMKDNSLYLENVSVYSHTIEAPKRYQYFKSGDIITKVSNSSFFITADTLIGETILFGYLDNGVKIYKYLKNNKYPMYPTSYDILNQYNQKRIDSVWSSYNTTVHDYDNNLDSVFFYSTTAIRDKLSRNIKASFNSSLHAKTTTEFFREAFRELEYFEPNNIPKNIDMTFFTIKEFIYIFFYNIDCLYEDKVENKTISEICIDENLPEKLKLKMQDLKCKKLNGDPIINQESLKTILEYIGFYQENNPDFLKCIIGDLKSLFSNIEFDSAMDINLPKYKDYLLNLTLSIPENYYSAFENYWLKKPVRISIDNYH